MARYVCHAQLDIASWSMLPKETLLQVGHIEDVVVDDGYRGHKLGQRCVLISLL